MNVLNRQYEPSSMTPLGTKLQKVSRLAAGAVLLASLSAAANAQVVEYFISSGMPADASATFKVDIAIRDNAVGPLDAYSLRVNYDPAHFDAVSVETPDLGNQSFTFEALEVGPEIADGPDAAYRNVSAAYSGSSGPNPLNGRFATVTFTRSAAVTADPTWEIIANPDVPGGAFLSGAESIDIGATVTFIPTPDPATPSNPSPANGALAVPTGSTFDWGVTGSGAVEDYEFRLWLSGDARPTTPTAIVATPGFVPGAPLSTVTDYRWDVVSRAPGATTDGPVWSFQTAVNDTPVTISYKIAGDPEAPNAPITLSVFLENNPDFDLGAFAFSVNYDAAGLSYIADSVTLAPTGDFDFEASSINPLAGRVNVAAASSGVASGNREGLLFTAGFTTTATPGTVDAFGIPTALTVTGNPDVVDQLVASGPDSDPLAKVFERLVSFENPPAPINPVPANNATGLATTVDASWDIDGLPVIGSTFEVFLWKAGDPIPGTPTATTTEQNTTFSALENFTSYRWQVVNRSGSRTAASPVWSFETDVDPGTAVVEYSIVGDASQPNSEFIIQVGLTNNSLNVGAFAFTFTFDPAELALSAGALAVEGSDIFVEQITTTSPSAGRINIAGLISEPENTGAEGDLFTIRFETTATPPAVLPANVPSTLVLGDNPDVPENLVTFGAVNDPIPHVFVAREGFVLDPPGAPVNPTPANGAVNVPVDVTLSWEAGIGGPVDAYDVFVWVAGDGKPVDPTATVTTTSYTPTLATSTDYRWQVTARNLIGSADSAVWSFETAFNEDTAVIAYAVVGNAADAGTTITVIASLENNTLDIGGFAFTIFFDEAEMTPLGFARPIEGSSFAEYNQLNTNVTPGRVNIAALISDEELTGSTGGLFAMDFVTNIDLALDGFGIPVNLMLGDNPDVPDNLITFGAVNEVIGHVFERRGVAPAAIQVNPSALFATAVVTLNADDETFTLSNIGIGADLNYTITSDEAWVGVAAGQESGSLIAGASTNVTVEFDSAALAPGVYTATLTVSDAAAINNPQTVDVTLTVTGAPIIEVTPLLVARTVEFGENAADEILTIGNVGSAPLNFSIELLDGGDAWLSVAPDAGTVAAGEATTTTLSFNVSTVPGGFYTARVRVNDPAAPNQPVDVNVELTVLDARAIIAVNPASISVETDFGVNVAPTTFTLTNDGGTTLFYSIVTNVPSWLAVAPTTGTLAPSASEDISVLFDVAGVEPGVYTGEIVVADPAAQNNPVMIPVTVTINETRAAIALAPNSFGFGVLPGVDGDPVSFSVTNTGFSVLNYSIDVDQSWLSVAPTTGTLTVGDSAFIDVNFATAALEVGSYTATITVADPSASNSPQTVEVTVTVLDPRPVIAFNPNAISVETDLNVTPSDTTFLIFNDGFQPGTILNYSLTTDASWISVSPTTGTLVADGFTSDSITLSFDIVGVEPGVYTANVVAESDEARNSPALLPVTITINETRPILAVDPGSIDRVVNLGENADPATVTVSNNGFSSLTYQVSLSGDAPETWIALSATTGTLEAMTNEDITVTFSTTEVPPGTYAATLTVTSPGAVDSPQSVAISLEVIDNRPVLAVAPDQIDIEIALGENADATTFTVANAGLGGIVNYAITASGDAPETWIALSATTGTLTAGMIDTIDIAFSTSEVPAGEYQAVLTVTAPGALESPQTVTINLTVLDETGPAVLAVNRTSIVVEAAQGSSIDTAVVIVSNTGESDIADLNASFTLAQEVLDWLSLDAPSAIVAGGSANLNVSFDISELSAGTYGATITVSATADNSPIEILVSLTVYPSQITFDFADSEQGWIFESFTDFFEPVTGEYNSERGSLEMTTQDNTNTFANWRTDPNNPIQIAVPGVAGVSKARKSVNVIAGNLGANSLYRTTWTVYSDTASSETPAVRLRVSSEDFAVTHDISFTSTGRSDLAPDTNGRVYTQYYAQPGHIDTFALFFDVLSFAPEFARADATVGLDRVTIESLGTGVLAPGLEVASFDFSADEQGFSFRTAEQFIAPASAGSVAEGLGLSIFGADEPGIPNSELPEVIFGFWGLESDVALPAGSLAKVSFTVRSDVPVGQENELSTFRLRVNDSSLAMAALLVTHPAEGAEVPSYDVLADEYSDVSYDLWFYVPEELDGETFVLSFDFLSTPGFIASVDPFWSVGLVNLAITVYDVPGTEIPVEVAN